MGSSNRTTTVAPCECESPGFCKRHGVDKPEAWWLLCQRREDYRKAWDANEGPGQQFRSAQDAFVRQPYSHDGPGTELKRLFRWLGIKDTGCGGCGGMAARMNRWGPAKCRKNLDTIVDHLEKQAAERNLPFSRFAATKLVRLAVRQAERKSNV